MPFRNQVEGTATMSTAVAERGERAAAVVGRRRLQRGARRPAKHSTVPLEIYLRNISEADLLSADQEKELARLVERGDNQARDCMIRANLRLVVSIARAYVGRGLDLQDLIAEGNLGLFRAVEGFDPDMNTRFSTYATFWIKQSIRRALQYTSKTIRLPSYMLTLLSKWRRASAELEERLNRTPTTEEIARRLKLSRRRLKVLTKAIRIYQSVFVSETADAALSPLDLLTDERAVAPDAQMVQNDELQRVLHLVEGLEPREKDVLRRRFGLNNHQPQTLKDIGDRLGLTRERVRQIELVALRKLAEKVAD
jgi:RNA polymerase primary sigma factor